MSPESRRDAIGRAGVQLAVQVARDGTLRCLAVTESTADAAAVEIARQAVLAATMPPLPEDYKGDAHTTWVAFFFQTSPKDSCAPPSSHPRTCPASEAAEQAHAADGASRRPRRTEPAAAASCSAFAEHRRRS
jgi:hypothetical protein